MAEEFNLSIYNDVYDMSFNQETEEIHIELKEGYYPLSNNVDLSNYYTKPQSDSRYKSINYVPTWSEISGKPTTFTPSAHTHTISEVINLQSTLDNKEDKLNAVNLGEILDTQLSIKMTPSADDEIVILDSITGDAATVKFSSFGGNVYTSNLVPYTGATQDVNIGAHYFESSAGFKTPTGTGTQALTANGGTFNLNTKADLEGGKVPATQLPSFVDDVLEFANLASFPATGESGKIYIAIDTNLTYRWGGSSYVVMSSSLALGETSSTAYRGDRGKIAYDHSQTTGNPHGTTKNDIGLGNVPNLDTTNAVNNSHTHSNKSILDLITEPFTTSLKSLYDGVVTSINNLLLTGQRLITSGEITKLSNTSGTNTGDETTSSIQTKRPLKTIEGQSLEGSGNIDLTKNDIGLGNVDNTSDVEKNTATVVLKNKTIDGGTY